jgi:hypothetical protein
VEREWKESGKRVEREGKERGKERRKGDFKKLKMKKQNQRFF